MNHSVRLALTLAIDRQGILDAVLNYAELASCPQSGTWAKHPGVRPWPYDPEQARQILAQHGWHPGDVGVWVARARGSLSPC